jgi:biotin-[acetyl-CoA-carboxylase] ligase BirA-like protein
MGSLSCFDFDSIPSTSIKASELIGEGAQSYPFVVIASQQSAGKGRLGRSWLSPEGNVYFTLVIEADQMDHSGQLPVPLRVATILAQEISKRFGVGLTIKWPNDLLFATAKIAGILCEATSDAQQRQVISIGVGINLNQSPSPEDQKSSSIKEILASLGQTLPATDAKELAYELALSLCGQLKEPVPRSIYQRFSIQNGHLWSDQASSYFQNTDIDDQGGFVVAELTNPSVITTHHSADHKLSWLYQKNSDTPLLLADAGNSKLKIAVFEGTNQLHPKLIESFDAKGSDTLALLKSLEAWKVKWGFSSRWPIFTGAVNTKGLHSITPQIERAGFQVTDIKKRSILVDFSRYPTNQLGIDRMALCEGAMNHFDGRPLLIFSAGTCHTIELIDANRCYLGGWILPGFRLKLNAMADYTDALPKINQPAWPIPKSGISVFGLNTLSSMQHGVMYESVFSMLGLKDHVEAMLGSPPTLLFSGGDGECIAQHFDAAYDPFLVLRGLKAMVLGGLSI